ncbi:DsrE family protein [Nocardioides perillae]|uniref:Putative peroxiredoxin n=1 Tax=Nocardioides perillae TaxID=1119534 RepID=A0A7Y9RV46_9ACTN|nr:putative peroxiredoxin [Nocardioides perillae]
MPPQTPAARRLVVKVTCGPEDAERSNQGLTVAATAVLAGAEVSLWLTGEATWYAVADRDVDLGLAGATPATELVDVVLASVGAGSRVVACTQCAARRGIVETDLREGAVIAGAAGFIEEVLGEGVQALVY